MHSTPEIYAKKIVYIEYPGAKKSDTPWEQPFLVSLRKHLNVCSAYELLNRYGNTYDVYKLKAMVKSIQQLTIADNVEFIPLINPLVDNYENIRGCKGDPSPFILRGQVVPPITFILSGKGREHAYVHADYYNYTNQPSVGQKSFLLNVFGEKLKALYTENLFNLLKAELMHYSMEYVAKDIGQIRSKLDNLAMAMDDYTSEARYVLRKAAAKLK